MFFSFSFLTFAGNSKPCRPPMPATLTYHYHHRHSLSPILTSTQTTQPAAINSKLTTLATPAHHQSSSPPTRNHEAVLPFNPCLLCKFTNYQTPNPLPCSIQLTPCLYPYSLPSITPNNTQSVPLPQPLFHTKPTSNQNLQNHRKPQNSRTKSAPHQQNPKSTTHPIPSIPKPITASTHICRHGREEPSSIHISLSSSVDENKREARKENRK